MRIIKFMVQGRCYCLCLSLVTSSSACLRVLLFRSFVVVFHYHAPHQQGFPRAVQQFLGLDVCAAGCILAGDTLGRLHFVDPRADGSFASPQIHKKDKARVFVRVTNLINLYCCLVKVPLMQLQEICSYLFCILPMPGRPVGSHHGMLFVSLRATDESPVFV